MTSRQRDIITGKIPATPQEIESLAREFPYLLVPVATALRDNPAAEADIPAYIKARMAICVGDDDTLAQIVGEEPEIMADFYGEAKTETPDTESAIDTFLNTYGGGASDRENDALTKMIFNPTPEYSALTDTPLSEADHQNSDDSTSRGIDSFLSSHPPASAPKNPEKQEKIAKKKVETIEKEVVEPYREGLSLSESLARVMIKKGNYRKALEIITELSLKNPEKITYFADQIRFLRKLIINENNN